MGKDLLTTREVAELLGVGTTSIKRWADEGRLDFVLTPGGHRRFLASSIRAHLNKNTKKQLDGQMIDRWLGAMLPFPNHYRLESLLFSTRDELGSWWEVANLVGKVLEKVGTKWAQGEIGVLHERLATETLERLLIKITDTMHNDHLAPIAILALADGEEHTLGLRLVELCLNSEGWNTIWAGLRTPTSELEFLIEMQTYQLLILSASSNYTSLNKLSRVAKRVSRQCSYFNLPLVLGGSALWPDMPKLKHCLRMKEFHELQAYLSALTFQHRN